MSYKLMPFNYEFFDSENVLLSNNWGEYFFINDISFNNLLNSSISKKDQIYQDLKSRQFISSEDDLELNIELASTKLRTKKQFLNDFTSLHMMVITYRCNHKCKYCQVTSEIDDNTKYDMNPNTARKVVDYIFMSPSPHIKIEFQGGEPLLNWKTIVETIEYAEKLNLQQNKKLIFVLCTNLTLMDEAKLKYLKKHSVLISTSLDGPKDIHDENRVLRAGGSSYNLFRNKLDLSRTIYDDNTIAPLMTTTSYNINNLRDVIQEYINLDFDSIFIRALNPYGYALDNKGKLGYDIDSFVRAYADALDYIISLNLNGKRFVELYAALLLRRIFTPFSTGFVDLQSPSGAGISGVIYDYNGDVYPADEGRMLAKMGNRHFFMGNVFEKEYYDIFYGDVITNIVKNSIVETMSGCFSCVYSPFCGSDPIRNYVECGDPVGKRPESAFCIKNNGIFKHIFNILKSNDQDVLDVFWSWLS
jgi:His-Xaa-Ser system radical SAM maturase HxsB